MKSLVLVAIISALAACADSPSLVEPGLGLVPTAPNFAKEINETTPTDAAMLNPCNGEPVVMTGTQTFRLHWTTTPSGGTHYGLTLSQNLTGRGLVTGAKYNATVRIHEQGSSRDPFPLIASFTFTTRVTSQSRVPNFYLDQTIKVTMNANGTVTSERDAIKEVCRGPAA